MSDLKKIAALFVLCAILAIYAKWSGMTPDKLGLTQSNPSGNVLGTQTQVAHFPSPLQR